MPDTNKNRIAVTNAAIAVVKMWEADIFAGEALIEKEDSLRAAVKELQR